MNDADVLQFATQVRPDMQQYYFGSLVNAGYENSQQGFVNWVKQHLGDGNDIQQYNQWVASKGSQPSTPPPPGGSPTQPPTLTPPTIAQPPSNNDNGALTRYFQSEPAFQNEYNRVKASGDNRTPEQWMQDHLANSPQDQQKFQQFQAGGQTGGQTGGGGLDFNQLTPGGGQSPTLPNSPAGVSGGGNFDQTQLGGQTGAYSSVGQTNQQQTGEQTQKTNQTQNQTGTLTGTVNTSGTSTDVSKVDTPFDLGALVNKELGSAGERDAASRSFLTDFMQTGGTGFQSQMDQAIRQSLSGPQLTGAGDSSRARIASYAASETGRRNADQRLQAAGMLGTAGATGATLGAFSPLFGRTNTNTSTGTQTTNQSTDQTTNLSGTTETFDLQKLVGSEAQAGSALGQSIARGFGTVPEGQPVKTGGCVVCTAYVDRGQMKPGAIRRAVNFKRKHPTYRLNVAGYLMFGHLLARAVLSSDTFAAMFRPFARAILYHEIYLSAPTRIRWKVGSYLAHAVFMVVTVPVGALALMSGRYRGVTDKTTLALLERNNLAFEV